MTSAKQRAAEAALAYLKPDTVLGVGTGSTVNFFIDALAAQRVAQRTARRMQQSWRKTTSREAPGCGMGFADWCADLWYRSPLFVGLSPSN